MYKRIERNTGKVFIIGDLHGMYQSLIDLLNKHKFNHNRDIVISVGDLIDRGNENIKCLELMNNPWFHAVMGNHEELAFASIRGIQAFIDLWVENGGDWFYKLDIAQQTYAASLIEKAYLLPRVIELNAGGKRAVICHATFPHHRYQLGIELIETDIIWHRAEARRVMNGEEVDILRGVDFAVYGHNRFPNVRQSANKIFLDTSCGYPGGKLSAIILNAKTGDMAIC